MRIVVSAGLLALATGAYAQQDPAVGQVAAAVDSHYNRLHSLRVHFVETYAGMGTERQETGDLLLRKPGEMRWSYTDPPGKLFLLDGKWAWFYSPHAAQVQKIPAKELDDLRSPLRFLLGHTQLAKELSALTLLPDGNGYTLSGTPRGMEGRISRIALSVDRNGVIHTMAIEEADGARTAFTFSGEEPNPPVSARDFVFEPPVGIPVIQGPPPV